MSDKSNAPSRYDGAEFVHYVRGIRILAVTHAVEYFEYVIVRAMIARGEQEPLLGRRIGDLGKMRLDLIW